MADIKNDGESEEDGAFLLSDLYPDAKRLFRKPQETATHAAEQGMVVLDTNVLLLPYTSGKQGFDEMMEVLKKIARDSRLIVPGHVAREFAHNRTRNLCDIFTAVSNHRSGVVKPKKLVYPLFEGMDEYGQLEETLRALEKATTAHQDALDTLLTRAASWGVSDPVQEAYADLFTDTVVFDPLFDRNDLQADLERRARLKIPPGYKDAGKSTNAAGDLIIWKTILALGKERQQPLLFVTGDKKADWQHRANNQGLSPRTELVEEYCQASGGCTFHVVQLSGLLAFYSANQDAIDDIRSQESSREAKSAESIDCPFCGTPITWHMGQSLNAAAFPLCMSCGLRFHAHRTRDGVITRKPHSRKRDNPPEQIRESLRSWFFEHYEEPEWGVLYDDGPYETGDILGNQFGYIVSDRVVEEVTREIELETGQDNWVPRAARGERA